MKTGIKTYQQKRTFEGRYRWFSGSFAWALHRVTGLALILYLSLHVYSISTLAQGAEAFNSLMKIYASPLFKVGEFASQSYMVSLSGDPLVDIASHVARCTLIRQVFLMGHTSS